MCSSVVFPAVFVMSSISSNQSKVFLFQSIKILRGILGTVMGKYMADFYCNLGSVAKHLPLSHCIVVTASCIVVTFG